MISPAVKVLSVALSISLVASCFPSCYTFAYADDLTDGGANYELFRENQPKRAGDGQADQGPDFQGLLRYEAAEKASSGSEYLFTVGSGRSFPSLYVLVEASYSLADSLIRFFSSRAYADDSSDSFSSSDEHGYFDRVLTSLEDITYLLGEIADYFRQAGSGISPLADINSVYDQLVSFKSSVGSMLGMSSGSASASNRWNFSLNGYSWNTGSYTLPWLVSMMWITVNNSSSSLASIKANSSYLSSLYSLSQKQWGYGYGGTAVIESNSPASWLQNVSNSVQTRKTFFGESSATVKTLAEILYLIDNKSGQTVSRLNSVIADNKAHSALVSTGISDVFGRLQTRKTFFGESEPTIKSVAEILYLSDNRLAQIVARIEDVRSYTGQTNTLLSKGLDDVLGSLQTRKIFSGDSEVTVKSVAEILYLSDNRLAQIVARIEDVRSYSSQTNTLLSKGFDDVLSSLADFNFSADIPSVDLSETNKFLGRLTGDVASIRDKFVLQDSLSDLLDLLVGDLQVPQTHAAISRIQDVMSTRFPFCIPSVVNVVLFGSLLADPAPPVWTFDIAGSPLVVDFADYGAFAEVSSWTVRLLFTAALLLNTRRFVYGLGGGY